MLQPHLGHVRTALLDKIERSQLSKTLQQLHDLDVVEVTWQAAYEDFVRGIWDIGRYHSRYVRMSGSRVIANIVLGPSDLEHLIMQNDAIEAERRCGLGCGTELEARNDLPLVPCPMLKCILRLLRTSTNA